MNAYNDLLWAVFGLDDCRQGYISCMANLNAIM